MYFLHLFCKWLWMLVHVQVEVWKCSSQAGWGFEQSALVKVFLSMASALELDGLWGLFQSQPFYDSMKYPLPLDWIVLGITKTELNQNFLFCMSYQQHNNPNTLKFNEIWGGRKNSSPHLKPVLSTLLHSLLIVKYFLFLWRLVFAAFLLACYENQVHRYSHFSGLEIQNVILCTRTQNLNVITNYLNNVFLLRFCSKGLWRKSKLIIHTSTTTCLSLPQHSCDSFFCLHETESMEA